MTNLTINEKNVLGTFDRSKINGITEMITEKANSEFSYDAEINERINSIIKGFSNFGDICEESSFFDEDDIKEINECMNTIYDCIKKTI